MVLGNLNPDVVVGVSHVGQTGSLRIAVTTSFSDNGNSDGGISSGAGKLESGCSGGCFACRADRVSSFRSAIVSSEQVGSLHSGLPSYPQSK